ncbi:MAG TPA: hypothetical protein VGA61_19655 [Anaerolineae bacterium]
MKKFFTGLMVLMLLALAVTPALAAGKPPQKGNSGKAGSVAPAGVQSGTRVQPKTVKPARQHTGAGLKQEDQDEVEQQELEQVDNEQPEVEQPEIEQQAAQTAAAEQEGPKQNQGKRAWGVPGFVNPHAKVILSGIVSAINPKTGTVVITPTHTNAIARKLLGTGTTVTLTMTNTTTFREWTSNGTQAASLTDLAVGDRIMTQGRFLDDVWSVLKTLIGLGTARQP